MRPFLYLKMLELHGIDSDVLLIHRDAEMEVVVVVVVEDRVEDGNLE